MLSESYQSENFVRRFLCSCVDVECRGAFRPLCYTKPLPENGEVNFANSPPLPPSLCLVQTMLFPPLPPLPFTQLPLQPPHPITLLI